MSGSLAHPADVALIVDALKMRAPRTGPFFIGVTGSVASGKTTLARALARSFKRRSSSRRVELIATDGFLLPNSVLSERGLDAKKGFPESFDMAGMGRALHELRRRPILAPAYSHVTYDIDPNGARWIEPPDILLVEGLGLGIASVPANPEPLVDALVFLEADESDLEAWFIKRFLGFWRAGRTDASSFYARFRDLDPAGATSLAKAVWAGVNLPNLRLHIAPVRAVADIVVRLDARHRLTEIFGQPATASD